MPTFNNKNGSFMLRGQSWVVVAETLWPTKPKMFVLCHFTVKVCQIQIHSPGRSPWMMADGHACVCVAAASSSAKMTCSHVFFLSHSAPQSDWALGKHSGKALDVPDALPSFPCLIFPVRHWCVVKSPPPKIFALKPTVFGHIQLTQDPKLELLEVDYHLLEAKSIPT